MSAASARSPLCSFCTQPLPRPLSTTPPASAEFFELRRDVAERGVRLPAADRQLLQLRVQLLCRGGNVEMNISIVFSFPCRPCKNTTLPRKHVQYSVEQLRAQLHCREGRQSAHVWAGPDARAFQERALRVVPASSAWDESRRASLCLLQDLKQPPIMLLR